MPSDAMHSALGVGNIHIPYQWSYADTAAREGATGLVAGDVGKLARQEDDNSLWILTATTPTWAAIGGGTGSLPDIGARVYHNANQAINSGAARTVAFNSEYYDTDACHDNVTNNSRLVAKTAGKYIVTFAAVFSAGGNSGDDGLWIQHSTRGRLAQLSLANVIAVTISALVDLAQNDYIEINIYYAAVSPNLLYSGDEYSPTFAMQKVG